MQNLPSINPKLETEKIVKFLKKTFSEQKIDKVVLGLSGGIDSTTVLFLLKEVMLHKNIFVVQMDYKPRKAFNIDLNGINVIDFPIKKLVDNFEGSVSNFLNSAGGEVLPAPLLYKARLGNIMARVRMIILFDFAKQLNALVCGTENKSENLLGYFTRFGDAASDIEPISHLYKTQVRQLAKYLKVPKEIIDQSPTAGLWDGQTDEKEFGFTYKEADHVLYRLFDKKKPTSPVILSEAKNLKKLGFKNAEKIIERVKNNQFKLKTPYLI